MPTGDHTTPSSSVTTPPSASGRRLKRVTSTSSNLCSSLPESNEIKVIRMFTSISQTKKRRVRLRLLTMES